VRKKKCPTTEEPEERAEKKKEASFSDYSKEREAERSEMTTVEDTGWVGNQLREKRVGAEKG